MTLEQFQLAIEDERLDLEKFIEMNADRLA